MRKITGKPFEDGSCKIKSCQVEKYGLMVYIIEGFGDIEKRNDNRLAFIQRCLPLVDACEEQIFTISTLAKTVLLVVKQLTPLK